MGKAISAAGELIEFTVTDEQRAAGKERGAERRRQLGWAQRKREAQAALSATDYLALPDRRQMTEAEKAYREALRSIIRSEPDGPVPDLPTL